MNICVDRTETEAEASDDDEPADEGMISRRPRPSNRYEVPPPANPANFYRFIQTLMWVGSEVWGVWDAEASFWN